MNARSRCSHRVPLQQPVRIRAPRQIKLARGACDPERDRGIEKPSALLSLLLQELCPGHGDVAVQVVPGTLVVHAPSVMVIVMVVGAFGGVGVVVTVNDFDASEL